MIISHKHKFIFIKTRKTAGSSIELALSRYCGENDVITPIGEKSERLRSQEGCGPQNWRKIFNPLPDIRQELKSRPSPVFRGRFIGDHPLLKSVPPQLFRLSASATKFILGHKYYNHMAAEIIKKRIGSDIWNSYFKFCFERNPWDKTVSHFNFRRVTMNQTDSFEKYLEEGFFCNDLALYSLGGSIAVDQIGRFERLKEDLGAICGRIGIPFDGWIPRAKSDTRPTKKPYQSYYSADQKELISKIFSQEIEHLGYRFEESSETNQNDNIAQT